MVDKTFLRFLQEIVGTDKTEVVFPVTEYMAWAGIPFQQLDDVLESVINDLHKMMSFLCTLELELTLAQQIKYARIVPSFSVLGTVVSVEFAEWTREVRQDDWLLNIVEEMVKKNGR